ncbi:3-deoxy-7-phosphoheptulonate synthase, partial [bacterium]|nr:3-deoxy-7-phosphoheptulonate synthase [bacterium]
ADRSIDADFADAAAPVMIAGPCAIESEEQIEAVVDFLRRRNIRYIRGGAFKPRTSPDDFQGLGEQGLRIISASARPAGLKIVTEVMDRSQIEAVCRHADILQVGSRSMFNYTLLTALGSVDKPVLLKRGMAATVDEWLQAAEYVSRGGNDRIILCERGIRTFEPRCRNMLDIAAIAQVRHLSGYPVVADPSHAAGRRELVVPLALAAAAAGADGLMVELHPDPSTALSDREQALDFDQFDTLLKRLAGLRTAREGKA